jgi:hypothetical protein
MLLNISINSFTNKMLLTIFIDSAESLLHTKGTSEGAEATDDREEEGITTYSHTLLIKKSDNTCRVYIHVHHVVVYMYIQ